MSHEGASGRRGGKALDVASARRCVSGGIAPADTGDGRSSFGGHEVRGQDAAEHPERTGRPPAESAGPGVSGAEVESRGQPLQVPGQWVSRTQGPRCRPAGRHGCLSPDPFPTYLCILNDHWPVFKSFQFSHKNPDFQHLTSWQTGLSGAPQQ